MKEIGLDRIDRREFLKQTAIATTLAVAPQWLAPARATAAAAPVSPVALRHCASYDRTLVYERLGTMFSDLGGLSGLVAGKRVALKINGVGMGAFAHGLHGMFAHSTHPETAYALCRHLLEAGAVKINIMESFNSIETISTILSTLGVNQAEFEALGNGNQVRFYSTRNKDLDVANPATGFDAYTRLDVLNGSGSGAAYMFDYFYVNQLWSPAKADVIVSLAKLKSHDVAGVTLSLKNMFGCLPNSIYGGTERIDFTTGPDEVQAKARNAACHLGVDWTPVGERTDHGVAKFDSERMPRLIADLNRVLPIHLSVVDGIMGLQGEMAPKEFTSVTTPGVLAAGFNALCVDSVCTAVMGGDPMAAPGTSLFPSGQNHLALAAAKGLGSNDLTQIPVVGEPIAKVRYDYYPARSRADQNPSLV